MDRFVSTIDITEEKNATTVTLHEENERLARGYLEAGENVFICGPCGVGKTFVLERVLGGRGVEIHPEHLRKSSHFLALMRPSTQHLYIEDYEMETSYKNLIEQVSEGRRLTQGNLIVTSRHTFFMAGFKTIIIPPHPPCALRMLVTESDFSLYAAEQSRGNIRDFLSYTEDKSDFKDIFLSPTEKVHEILCDPRRDHDLENICEHGHTWDIMFENVYDSEGVDMYRCAASFSDADVLDSALYAFDWGFYDYFVHAAVLIPYKNMGEPLVKETIRPGSSWTRHGNMRMRSIKLDKIRAASGGKLRHGELLLLRKYAAVGNIDILMDYNITTQAFDVMNHISMEKLKPKVMTSIKKRLKNAISERQG